MVAFCSAVSGERVEAQAKQLEHAVVMPGCGFGASGGGASAVAGGAGGGAGGGVGAAAVAAGGGGGAAAFRAAAADCRHRPADQRAGERGEHDGSGHC